MAERAWTSLRGIARTATYAGLATVEVVWLVSATWAYAIVVGYSNPVLSVRGLEQNVVFGVARILLDGYLYTDPIQFPFVVIQYSPGYYFLVSTLAHLAGVTSDLLPALYFLARSVSVVFMALTAGIIGLMVLFRGHHPSVAVGAAVMALLATFPWAGLARPDSAYLFFLMFSCLCLIQYCERRRRVLIICAALLLFMAFLCKQTAGGFLALFLLPIALAKPRRFAIGDVALGLIVFCTASGLTLLFCTAFTTNSLIGLSATIDYKDGFQNAILPFLRRDTVLIALWILAVAFLRNGCSRFLLNASAFSLIIGAVASGKFGSAENYFDEFILLAVATIFSALPTRPRASPLLDWTPAVAAIFLVVSLPWTVMQSVRFVYWDTLRSGPMMQRVGELHELVPEGSKYILALDSDSPVVFPDRVAVATIDVVLSAYYAGRFDLDPVRRAIQSGDICLAILAREIYQRIIGIRFGEGHRRLIAISTDLIRGFSLIKESEHYVLLRSASCHGA